MAMQHEMMNRQGEAGMDMEGGAFAEADAEAMMDHQQQ